MSTPPPVPPEPPEIPAIPASPPPVPEASWPTSPPPTPAYPPSPPPVSYPPVVPPQPTPGNTTKVLLFGCLGLVVLAVIGIVIGGVWIGKKVKGIAENPEQFIAEMVVKQNPDLELVSVDRSTKEVVIRDKQSGETASFSLDDVQSGKIMIKKSDGTTAELGPAGIKVKDKDGTETVVGADGQSAPLPDWVPAYPGDHTTALSTRQEKDGAVQGTSTFATTDKIDQAAAAYQKALEDRNFEVTVQENSIEGGKIINLQATAALPEGLRTVTARFMFNGPQTMVRIEYGQE